MRLREGERVHELLVQAAAEDASVLVDGRRVKVRVEGVRAGCFVVHIGSQREMLHLVRDGSLVHIFWRGVVHRITEERERASGPQRGGAGGLEAPMPGKVIVVRVRVGEEVVKGQELLVIEAMKMENALRAPRAGRVKSVLTKAGEMVSPGAVLVELE